MSKVNPSASKLVDTMRAWAFTRRGHHRNVLELLHLPVPTLPASPPKPTYRIRISHAALNPGTLVVMSLIPAFFRAAPTIAELDFCGMIESASGEAARFKPGERVFGAIDAQKAMKKGVGTLAEWMVVQEDEVGMTKAPEEFTDAEAAALSASGQTAVKMCQVGGLSEKTDLTAMQGKRVLINGASGGVGTVLVQVVKALGVGTVVALCSGKNVEMVKGLGADEVVDYRMHDPVGKHLSKSYGTSPFDIVLDTVGIQALYESSPAFLKPDGLYINIGGYDGGLPWMMWSMFKNLCVPTFLGGTPRKWIFFSTTPSQELADDLEKLIKGGGVKPIVGATYQFEEALEAFDLLETKRARGKIVVKVQDV